LKKKGWVLFWKEKEKKNGGTKIKLFGQIVSVLFTHTPQIRQCIPPMAFIQIVMEDDDGEF
jgi:hypothetical protein